MTPRGESPEPLIVSEQSAALETEGPTLVKNEKLSKEGLPEAAARHNIPQEIATWELVANAVAKKNGLNPVYNQREAEYHQELGQAENLGPHATKEDRQRHKLQELKEQAIDLNEERPEQQAAA